MCDILKRYGRLERRKVCIFDFIKMYILLLLQIVLSTIIQPTLAKYKSHRSNDNDIKSEFAYPKLSPGRPEYELQFIVLDDVCLDCYYLLNNSDAYSKCRSDCYTSDIFKGCVEALLKTDKLDTYKAYIKNICYLNEMTLRYAPKFVLRKRLH